MVDEHLGWVVCRKDEKGEKSFLSKEYFDEELRPYFGQCRDFSLDLKDAYVFASEILASSWSKSHTNCLVRELKGTLA